MDVPLTEFGIEQARTAGTELAGVGASRLVSSDQLRAVQTATIIAGFVGLPVETSALLREQFLGDMEGKLSIELEPLPIPEGKHINEIRWSGGESVVDVWGRCRRFVEQLKDSPSPVIVVSHGQTLACLATLLDGDTVYEVLPGRFKNAQVIRFDVDLDALDVQTGSGPAQVGPSYAK